MIAARSMLTVFIAACTLITGCCPTGRCDYAFRPNWPGRHAAFVENLNTFVGRPFAHICVAEKSCPPETLESGLVRYTAVDYRPWLKGCTFWFNVDAKTHVVASVGYTGTDKACSVLNLE